MRGPIVNDNGTIHRYTVEEAFVSGVREDDGGVLAPNDWIAFSYEGETVVGRLNDSWDDNRVFEVVDVDGDKRGYRTGLVEGDVLLLGRRSR